jgi:hypothetical protein
MKNRSNWLGITVLVLAMEAALPADTFDPSSSPFADKPSNSYSNYRGANLQTVYPIWGQAPFEDFGSREITFDTSGERTINQVPAAGVHPRIFFTPDDLPDIRRRLKETLCGQAAWKNLLSWTLMMKGQYDDTQDYAKPDVWNGGFGGLHGRVPLFRLGIPRSTKGHEYNQNPEAAQIWNSLVDGTATDFPDYYWNTFALEAFRCLVEQDQPGAEKLAKAVITAMKISQAKRDADRAAKHVTDPPAEPVGRFQLAYIYDFLFNWLTPQQRSAIHDELAATTWSHDNYGTFNAATSSRSNWATFSYWLMEVLAIEGEPGFNDLKVRGMYRGWRNLFTYGWFKSGAVFEGEAKDQLGFDGIIPFTMRQKLYGFQDLCGHPYLRAYAENFLPASVIPTQDGFIKYDLLGGAHGRPMWMDTLGLKYMFPDDKRIDWLYRCAIGEHYENVPDRSDGYRNDLLFALVFATDFDPANQDPAKLGVPNTFFCGERALMMTRSGWDSKDAMMLNLHTRQANGGHPFADRNGIVVAGAGRVWSPPGYASFTTEENSVVNIDGQTQDNGTPGRMVGFVDQPLATLAVGDASYCWDWNSRTDDVPRGLITAADVTSGTLTLPAGWELEKHSVNDFAFLKLPFAYLDTPLSQNPHWIEPAGAVRPVLRKPFFPVQRAFRTAGLVRGSFPYGLIVDDIQKDTTVHTYNWTLALEPDIQIVSVNKTGTGMDVILTGDDPAQANPRPNPALPSQRAASSSVPANQPMLLVRVLDMKAADPTKAADPQIVEPPNATNVKKYQPVRRLVISTNAVAPDFKALLYPYRNGASLPETTWDSSHKQLTVAFTGQKDQITFTPDASGATAVSVARDGVALASIKPQIGSLTNP